MIRSELISQGSGQQKQDWFVLHVLPRHEKKVASLLELKGLETFLPTYMSRRQWFDRIKHVDLPLFPNYVFCHFNHRISWMVRTTPGVLRVVGPGGRPSPLKDEEVESLRNLVRAGIPAKPISYVAIGKRVRITSGPLSGICGIVRRLGSQQRVVISVDLIQRSVLAKIDLSDLSEDLERSQDPTVVGNRSSITCP